MKRHNLSFSFKPKSLLGLVIAPLFALAAIIPFGFFLLWGTLLVSTITGIVLGFKAGLLAGIIILVVEPAPLIVGVAYLFFNVDLAQRLADWLTKVL